MEAILLVAGLGTMLAVGITVHTLTKNRAKQHAAALRTAAERRGWGYREEVALDGIPGLDRFELFRQGRSRKLRDLLTSPPGDPRIVVFEYSYVVSSGNSQQTHRQTVFYATGDTLDLPSFSLRPERFFHRIAGVFGYRDINFERRPEFSRLYLLRGADEAAVRGAFSDPVIDFFERRPGTCATGAGRELLFWRPSRRVLPADLDAFIAEGRELSERFASSRRTA
jgi:hypothetical protein